MKKTMLLLLMPGLLLIAGCKKMEEDKGLEMRTVGKRLQAQWVLDHYYVNAIEKDLKLIHFSFYGQKDGLLYNVGVHTVQGYGSGYVGSFEHSVQPNTPINNGTGTLALSKKQLLFNMSGTHYYLEFQLVSLSKNKLVLEIENSDAEGVYIERFEFITN